MYLIALSVLQAPNGSPIPDGMRLYRSLIGGKVVIATDGPKDKAQRWLFENGCVMHDDVIGEEAALGEMDLRVRQVEALRHQVLTVVVFETDTDRALALWESGVTTLLFGAAAFVRPDHRMSRAHKKTWDELQQEIQERSQITVSSE